MTAPECGRCGALMVAYGENAVCSVCEGVEPTLEQAHVLLDRVLYHWMYGTTREPLRPLQRDVEVWLRVAGPPKS